MSRAKPYASAANAHGPVNWGEVVRQHYGPVFGIALRLLGNEQDALDASQEAFFRAMRAADMVDGSRPLMPWLSRIVSNICIDWLRRRGVLRFDNPERLSDAKSASPTPDQLVSAVADADRIRRCTERLPETYRAVIVLKYQAGLSNEEISKELKISREALRVRLFRGKKALRELFTEGRPQ